MGSLSVWHWLIILIMLATYFVPAAKILSKAGYSGWWCLILLIPVVNIVMVWVFAFSAWPARRGQAGNNS